MRIVERQEIAAVLSLFESNGVLSDRGRQLLRFAREDKGPSSEEHAAT